MGICIGMQALFESSTESLEGSSSSLVQGLGVVPGTIEKFTRNDGSKREKSIPQMGWNEAKAWERQQTGLEEAQRYGLLPSSSSAPHFYFVHSYRAAYDAAKHSEWALTTTQYGSEVFLSSIARGNIFATQFHPEKSARAGLEVLRAWLQHACGDAPGEVEKAPLKFDSFDRVQNGEAIGKPKEGKDGLTKRVVACLDVRSNDDGDLVVTKGESYDVREKAETATSSGEAGSKNAGNDGAVRNLGKPVDLAHRYYLEGSDEIVFLNITSFRSSPLRDQPMLSVLQLAAAECFVPLTIGGGIKDFTEPDSGQVRSAKEVADEYFRAGADKVSIGSEAVLAVEEILQRNGDATMSDPGAVKQEALTGKTGIEMISKAYGAQAVVVSIDPRRVYLAEGEEVPVAHKACLTQGAPRTEDEGKRWWYRCTIKGGREDRDLDVVQLARGVERLGAGEILLNSIDRDGSNKGFDRQLVDLVRSSVHIPVVASSGAGVPQHFADIFKPQSLRPGEEPSSVEAALAAGIFHRQECTIRQVKDHLLKAGFPIRDEDVAQGAGAVVEKVTQEKGVDVA